MRTFAIMPILLILFTLSACTEHQLYRTDFQKVCSSSEENKKCEFSALQNISSSHAEKVSYRLGFIEFDDQGELWDRNQMRAVLKDIKSQGNSDKNNDEIGKDLIMIVYVHGWKNNAEIGNGNIDRFRDILSRISAREVAEATKKPRTVYGVYLGWRGLSVVAPGLKELSLWDRKNTANKVGLGGVLEVLNRLEQIKTAKVKSLKEKGFQSKTRLVVVGHSLGGAVVHSAITNVLLQRLSLASICDGSIACEMDPKSDARGFGDLVVLINPAVEAIRFATLSNLANERKKFSVEQKPVLAVLTSEADNATKLAFPAARIFSTFFEKTRFVNRYNPVDGSLQKINQLKANITGIGHFEPYLTHRLDVNPTNKTDVKANKSAAVLLKNINNDLRMLDTGWKSDKPGKKIKLHDTVLTRTDNSIGRNPYLIIQVSEEIIPDHSTITGDSVVNFLSGLILMAAD